VVIIIIDDEDDHGDDKKRRVDDWGRVLLESKFERIENKRLMSVIITILTQRV